MEMIAKKLIWACRRGMKELDLILEPFVQQQFSQLTKPQQLALEQLLQLDDLTLFACLFQHQPLPQPELQRMVEQIIAFKSDHVAN